MLWESRQLATRKLLDSYRVIICLMPGNKFCWSALINNKQIFGVIIFGVIAIIVVGFILTSISISQQAAQQVNLQSQQQQQQAELQARQAHLRISPRWLV